MPRNGVCSRRLAGGLFFQIRDFKKFRAGVLDHFLKFGQNGKFGNLHSAKIFSFFPIFAKLQEIGSGWEEGGEEGLAIS